MSAFFLYFNDGRPDHAISPETIGPQLTHFPWVQWKEFKGKNLQVIYTENKTDTTNIFPDSKKNLLYLINGYILESEKGIARIDPSIQEYSIQDQLAKRYEQGGINSCIGLNGQYNFLAWNPQSSTLEIANDRLGICQVFFARIDDHRFVLTTDIDLLKSIPEYTPKISRRGIFDLLYKGMAFEERTVLEGVTRLLPNASYQASQKGLKLIEEQRLPFSKENWGIILPAVLDKLDQKYVQSVKRAFTEKDKVLLLMSGGKDSRLYSHFLSVCRIFPQCITSGESYHTEAYLGREVSHTLGFPWKRIGLDETNNQQYLIDSLKLDSYSRRVLPFIVSMDPLSQIIQKYDYVTGAFLSDAVIGCDYIATQIGLGKNEQERARNYINFRQTTSFTERELNQLFPTDGNDLIQEYQNDVTNLIKRLSDEPYHQLASLWIRTSNRFKIGGIIRTMAAAAPLRLPCIDNDLLDFTFSLPPVMLCERLNMSLFLQSKNRALASIPLDNDNNPAEALSRRLKYELGYKCWYNYNKMIKLPLLKLTKRHSNLTTVFYKQLNSIEEQGLKGLWYDSAKTVSSLEGVLDVKFAKEFLTDRQPKEDALRSLVTAAAVAKTFNT